MRIYLLGSGGNGMEKILTWLAENSDIEEVSSIKNPEAFLGRIEEQRPGMVFIILGSGDFPGLKIGKVLKETYPDVKVIFVAAERDYAIDAFEVGAYGYLLCPVEREKYERLFTQNK